MNGMPASSGNDRSTAHEHGSHEDSDLRESLDSLSMIVAGRGDGWFEAMLTHVAEFAVKAIPGADGSGLTLIENGNASTIVASTPFVQDVDAVQYGLGEGPCITAAAQGRTVRSGSLGTDRSWPRFGARAVRLGVHSALSLPLTSGSNHVFGSMNVYAHKADAFDDRAARLGELFAIPAAATVYTGQSLAEARTMVSNLESALSSRAVIDQALGILMSRTGCTPDEAFDKLRALSQKQNVKSAVVAKTLVDQATRRARARLPHSSSAD